MHTILVSVPNIKIKYKWNETIGIGTLYRQVPKIKVSYRASTGKSGIGASLIEM